MVRRDSIASKLSAPRPATRMSLADMVKDDKPPPEEKQTSKAELNALNALVKESIKRDKKELRKVKQEQIGGEKSNQESPRKSVQRRDTAALIRDFRLEEFRREAAAKRARRQRFLRNRKASFIMMLTSPYAEVNSISGGRKLSQDFAKLRKSMSNANLSLALREEGDHYDDYAHDKYGGTAHLPWKKDRDYNDLSPRKAMAMRRGQGYHEKTFHDESTTAKDTDNVLDSIENYLQRDKDGKQQPPKSKHKQAEENRISKEIELAARQMRRREREERREQRIRLEKEERKRRKDEIEEQELIAIMSSKPMFENPYDKNPGKIPDLNKRNPLNDDDEEIKWIRAEEKKILRERRRSKREAELHRKQHDEKMRRKALNKTPKDRSPRSHKEVPEIEDDATLDVTVDGTPETETPETEKEAEEKEMMDVEENKAEEEEEENKVEEEEEEKEAAVNEEEVKPEEVKDEQEEEPQKEETEKPAEKKKEKEKEKKKKKEKEEKPNEEKKEEEVPVAEEKEEAPKEEEEEKEESKPEEEDKADEEIEEDDFDGYNDSEEDDDDLVAIYIEKEVRQMRADFNAGKPKEDVDRGTNLLKALRKHTDIVSWSRRRLRWFAAAHTYMGSGYVELGDLGKATSHHRADFRIGEALEDTTIQSRALEHLARVSVLESNVPQALEHLAKRAHLPRNSEQSARIYHEMANCFFQLGAMEYARDAAVESLQAAKEGGHSVYTLQSTLLLAVCQSKLSDYDSARNSFETALKEARHLNDQNTIAAIEDAKKQLEMRRAAMVRDKWKGKKSVVNEPIPESAEPNPQ